MIAVITGDVINSRKVNAEIWLPRLKEYFSKITLDTDKWEIYRGDSFQIEVETEKALKNTIYIKELKK